MQSGMSLFMKDQFTAYQLMSGFPILICFSLLSSADVHEPFTIAGSTTCCQCYSACNNKQVWPYMAKIEEVCTQNWPAHIALIAFQVTTLQPHSNGLCLLSLLHPAASHPPVQSMFSAAKVEGLIEACSTLSSLLVCHYLLYCFLEKRLMISMHNQKYLIEIFIKLKH